MTLTMTVMKQQFAVWKIKPDAMIPIWLLKERFFSVMRTEEELSIVCEQDLIGDHIDELSDVKLYMHWSCLKIVGPLEFSMVGILAEVSGCLAQANISIFVQSTFDTDYILIQSDVLTQAKQILEENGILFI